MGSEKIAYKVNQVDKDNYERESVHKVERLNDLFLRLNEFTPTSKKELLSQDAIHVFIKRFIDKYSNEYPSTVSSEMMFKLSDINTEKLFENHEAILDLKGELSVVGNEYKVKEKDFNLYLTDPKEIERYHKYKKLYATITEFYKTEDIELNYHQKKVFFSPWLIYSYETNKWTPNLNCVKKEEYAELKRR